MAAKTVQVDVELKTSLKNARQTFETISSSGGFAGKEGVIARQRIEGHIKSLEEMFTTLQSFDKSTLSHISKTFKEIFDSLTKYAAKATKISPQAAVLSSKLQKHGEELSAKQNALSAARDRQALVADAINKAQQSGAEFYKLKTDGSLSKQRLVDPGVIAANMAIGKAKATKNGQPLEAAQLKEITQQITEYNKLTNEIKKLKNSLEVINTRINETKRALAAQNKIDKESGFGGSELVSATVNQGLQAQSHIANLKEGILSEERTKIATQNAVNINTNLQKQQTALSKAFKAFSLYAIAVRAAKVALREAKQTIVELDKYLTEQAMVTGKTRAETYALVEGYQALAKRTGATTKEIASVATEYMKQGKTIEDSLTLTEAAVKAAKVARVSVGDSVNYLTTALNGFQLSAKDAMLVSDKFAAVAASSATDYDELAIALSKVASQANLAGMSIDYTTALLTKGLETTREAPETMGTALKTIIARMRELGDYGETLEGDTDINNVESQLQYVGIALRNAQGELRSTEDVLDELGRKWDTLNTNQQAAVAKALAGTRQQSRLIAMMADYERVIELQEISQRSAGATSAQASVYLQGIEASLNKIRVSYEAIITNLSNNEVITGLLDGIGVITEFAANFVDSWIGAGVAIAVVGTALAGIVSKKILENEIAKNTLELQRAEQIANLKAAQQEIIEQEAKKRNLQLDEQDYKTLLAQYKMQVAINKQTAEGNRLKKTGDTSVSTAGSSDAQQAAKAMNEVAAATHGYNSELLQALNSNKEFANIQATLNYLINENTTFSGLNAIALAAQTIKTKLHTLFTKKDTEAVLANKAAKLGLIAVAALVVAAITAGVIALVKMSDSSKQAAENIGKLSNQIYTLNKKQTEINNLTASFDELDKKIFKTSEDLTAMVETAESLEDSIDFTVGGTLNNKKAEQERQKYRSLSVREKIQYAKENAEKLAKIEEETRNNVREQYAKHGNTLLSDARARSEIQATIVNDLHEAIDSEDGYSDVYRKSAEKIAQNILENLSAKEQALAMENKTAGDLAKTLLDVGASAEQFLDGKSLTDKVNAFKEIAKVLDGEMLESFIRVNKEYASFSNLTTSTLQYIEDIGFTTQGISDFFDTYTKLGGDSESAFDAFNNFIEILSLTGNLEQALSQSFGSIIKSTEDLQTLVNSFETSTGGGMQTLAQEITSLENRLKSFYDKALKWNEMTSSEQEEFLSDNVQLFENNPNLLAAVRTGNMSVLRQAMENSSFSEMVHKQIADIEKQLDIERTRKGTDAYNEAYVEWLEEKKQFLQDSNKLYSLSYKTVLEQEQKRLNEYKNFLQEQQDALVDSLNKRKEAYEKYFGAINEAAEDQDYEEQLATLTNNLAKLGSSTTASASKQKADIQKQLTDLEKERLSTLRQRAQDSIIENLDSEVSEINEKFSKLLDNNQMLLAAMTSDLKDPAAFVTNLLTQKIGNGMTAAGLNDYVTTLGSVFGASLGGLNLNDISAKTTTNNNMILNIAGQEVSLTQNESDIIYKTIYAALAAIGRR